MIRKILKCYVDLLNEYLLKNHRHPEGVASVGQIGSSTENIQNQMVVSLLNVERETAGGINARVSMSSNGTYTKMQPSLWLNLNVILAAVFDVKRYEESLSVLSDAMGFVQVCPKFEVDGQAYTIEIVNCSMQDYNNVWTLLGGHCYPSVICKIRNLVIDGLEVVATGKAFNSPTVDMNN